MLMTPYFCDGMTMGCFPDENDNNGSSFQKNGIEMGLFSHTNEV